MTAEGTGTSTSTADTIISAVYTTVFVADLVIVADLLSGGNLHRWAGRQMRRGYCRIVVPVQREAEMRRAAAWVVWEAMQVLEDANK